MTTSEHEAGLWKLEPYVPNNTPERLALLQSLINHLPGEPQRIRYSLILDGIADHVVRLENRIRVLESGITEPGEIETK